MLEDVSEIERRRYYSSVVVTEEVYFYKHNKLKQRQQSPLVVMGGLCYVIADIDDSANVRGNGLDLKHFIRYNCLEAK